MVQHIQVDFIKNVSMIDVDTFIRNLVQPEKERQFNSGLKVFILFFFICACYCYVSCFVFFFPLKAYIQLNEIIKKPQKRRIEE